MVTIVKADVVIFCSSLFDVWMVDVVLVHQWRYLGHAGISFIGILES